MVNLSVSVHWPPSPIGQTLLKPQSHHEKTLAQMLDQVEAWAGALKPLRG
jgi:hypothetical protein